MFSFIGRAINALVSKITFGHVDLSKKTEQIAEKIKNIPILQTINIHSVIIMAHKSKMFYLFVIDKSNKIISKIKSKEINSDIQKYYNNVSNKIDGNLTNPNSFLGSISNSKTYNKITFLFSNRISEVNQYINSPEYMKSYYDYKDKGMKIMSKIVNKTGYGGVRNINFWNLFKNFKNFRKMNFLRKIKFFLFFFIFGYFGLKIAFYLNDKRKYYYQRKEIKDSRKIIQELKLQNEELRKQNQILLEQLSKKSN